jgi:hypothetical protein
MQQRFRKSRVSGIPADIASLRTDRALSFQAGSPTALMMPARPKQLEYRPRGAGDLAIAGSKASTKTIDEAELLMPRTPLRR